MKKVLIYLLFLLFSNLASSQSQGPLNPSTSGTDNSVGTVGWTSTDKIFIRDGFTANSGGLTGGDISYFLTASNFGFTIPSGSVIDGIEVVITRNDDGVSGGMKDNALKLIQNGVISGSDLGSNSNWPNISGDATYGSSTNLWGLTWTSADINNSNFGVAISAKRAGGSGPNVAHIDNITIKVYYSASLPIELISFKGTYLDTYNYLIWVTASETNNNYFMIERSNNGLDWFNVGSIFGHGTTSTKNYYEYKDFSRLSPVCYYRLSQIDYDGAKKSFDIIAVSNSSMATYPKKLIKVTNLIGDEVDDNYSGIKFYFYNDNTVLKKYEMKAR